MRVVQEKPVTFSKVALQRKRKLLYSTLKTLVKPLLGSGIGRIRPVANLYQAIAPRIIPKESHIVEVEGFKLRVLTNGHIGDIATELLFRGIHEPTTTKVFKQILKPNDNVIDVGANIGYFSLLSSKLIGHKGKVYAYEPDRNNLNELLANIELNGFYNIKTREVALSDKTGRFVFYTSKVDSAHHSLIKTKIHDGQSIVTAAKLDDFLIDEPIKLLKTDTEGNELAILKGAEHTIRTNDINLIVEVYEDALKASGTSQEELWDFITSNLNMNYIYLIDDYKERVELITKLPKRKLACNILCSRSEI